LQPINEYDETTDKQNLSGGQDDVKIHLTPNKMAIFYPNDAHKACCKIDENKKV
jgi:YhcH/YjgK/YiaL family protein